MTGFFSLCDAIKVLFSLCDAITGLFFLCDAITLHYSYLADIFIQRDLQLITLSRARSPLEQCGVKGLAQTPNSCADLIVATPGLEPPTFQGHC